MYAETAGKQNAHIRNCVGTTTGLKRIDLEEIAERLKQTGFDLIVQVSNILRGMRALSEWDRRTPLLRISYAEGAGQ